MYNPLRSTSITLSLRYFFKYSKFRIILTPKLLCELWTTYQIFKNKYVNIQIRTIHYWHWRSSVKLKVIFNYSINNGKWHFNVMHWRWISAKHFNLNIRTCLKYEFRNIIITYMNKVTIIFIVHQSYNYFFLVFQTFLNTGFPGRIKETIHL